MDNRVQVRISGKNPEGQKRIFEIIREALESNGYRTINVNASSWATDRLMAYNEAHDVDLESVYEKATMTSNS